MAFEGVDDVRGGDGLHAHGGGPPTVVDGHGVPEDVKKKILQHSPGFLVDESGDALDPSSTSQTTNVTFCDALDVVAENLAVTFGASPADSFFSFAAS